MDSLTTTSDNKSFWKRPEGKFGMGMLGLGAVGLYFALPTLLVFMGGLVALLGQTIAAVVLMAVLGAILYVITNNQFLTVMSLMFKSSMRWMTGKIIEIDPINIMKSYVSDLKLKRESMAESRSKLKGQIRILEEKIKSNTNKFNEAMGMAQAAQKAGDAGVLSLNGRKAGRLERVNTQTYIPLLKQMQIHYRVLCKYYDVTGVVIEDLENEVEVQAEQRALILASYSAMRAAKDIINGEQNKREIFDQALEFAQRDYGMKIGEIEDFMENSKSFIDGLDIQNGMYEAQALERLREWENRADQSILLGSEKTLLLQSGQDGAGSLSTMPLKSQEIDYANLIR